MRKFQFTLWVTLASIVLGAWPFEGQYDPASIDGIGSRNLFAHSRVSGNRYNKSPMHKAIFTQRGYIQFLRWELPVPDIEEFTFCLWVKSVNLTHSHSIFSYSLGEKDRLLRSWISPLGLSVHLEIGQLEIIAHPTRLEEHRWHHICQSWENRMGHYALWINGRKEVEGYSTRLVGHVIPRGGDIVVGQEYTDFDKGLEEGIEGAVLGFNLLLASAFDRPKYFDAAIDRAGSNTPAILSPSEGIPPDFGRVGIPAYLGPGVQVNRGIPSFGRIDGDGVRFVRLSADRGLVEKSVDNLGVDYPTEIVNGRREGTFESTLKEYLGDQELFGRSLQRRSDGQRRAVSLGIVRKSKREASSRAEVNVGQPRVKRGRESTRRSAERLRRWLVKAPLGLQLVISTYAHCEIGRGSPFIGGSKMLISWTRTPVKVFGGAVLKNAKNTCGDF